MARLLRGRHFAADQPRLNLQLCQLGLLAMLLHDTGYLKKRADTDGTGAKYTVTHVDRSAKFATELMRQKGFTPQDIQSVQNMIHCTGVDTRLSVIPFHSELEKVVGFSLGTSDLLGQMAAEDYVDKLPVLYSEFAEAARFTGDQTHFVSKYSNAEELMSKTRIFGKNLCNRSSNPISAVSTGF